MIHQSQRSINVHFAMGHAVMMEKFGGSVTVPNGS